MFIMSPAELAPVEDQGVIFGIVDAPANSTLDQTSHYAAAANRVFHSVPETDFTFQITFPANGFGGLVVKPWGERKRTIFQILPEVQQKLRAIPGIRMFAGDAAGAARRRPVPGGVRHRIDRGAGPDPRLCPADPAEGGAERHVCLSADHRCQDRSAAVGTGHRSRQGGRPRPQSPAGRRRTSASMVGGNLCEPLQHRRPQLQGHPADQARRAPQPRSAARTFTSPGRTDSWCRSARSPRCATPPCRAR